MSLLLTLSKQSIAAYQKSKQRGKTSWQQALTPMMKMRDKKLYGQQEDLTESWITVPLISGGALDNSSSLKASYNCWQI